MKIPGFIASFQDLGTPDFISFNGLIDHTGKYKKDYFLIQEKWVGVDLPIDKKKYRILKQSKYLETGRSIKYYAVKNNSIGWELIDDTTGIDFHWYLLKTDGYDNCVQMKHIGDGKELILSSPDDYKHFELLLSVENDHYTIQTTTKLNTPLNAY